MNLFRIARITLVWFLSFFFLQAFTLKLIVLDESQSRKINFNYQLFARKTLQANATGMSIAKQLNRNRKIN